MEMTERGSRGAEFIWHTRIFFDDLDPMGMLHNARYLVLIERAEASFNVSRGRRWESEVSNNPDQFYVVREQTIRYESPVRGAVGIAIHLWLESLGRTSATFAFEIRSRHGVHATASRTIVKLDPATHKPVPWTEAIRASFSEIFRPQPRAGCTDG